jgi:hypothetical protein
MAYGQGKWGGVTVPQTETPFQGPRTVPLDLQAIRTRTQPGAAPPGPAAPVIGFGQFDAALELFRGNIIADLESVFSAKLERRAYHQLQAYNVGTAWVKARPEEKRVYFFIVNNSAVNNLFVAYAQLDGTNGSIAIGPGGFYEPWVIPTNEIWLQGSAAGTQGILSIATAVGH